MSPTTTERGSNNNDDDDNSFSSRISQTRATKTGTGCPSLSYLIPFTFYPARTGEQQFHPLYHSYKLTKNMSWKSISSPAANVYERRSACMTPSSSDISTMPLSRSPLSSLHSLDQHRRRHLRFLLLLTNIPFKPRRWQSLTLSFPLTFPRVCSRRDRRLQGWAQHHANLIFLPNTTCETKASTLRSTMNTVSTHHFLI